MSGPSFIATHPPSTLLSALGPRQPTMGYISDLLVLWIQPVRSPGRSQRTRESEAWVPMHLFPSLHLHLGLVACLCFSRWLSFQVPVTTQPGSLGPKSGNSSAYTSPGQGTIPYGSPTPTPLPINPPLNAPLLVSHQSPVGM